MSEMTDSFTGRRSVKHKSFAFYHPAAFCVAQIAVDIPIFVIQTAILALPVYFMVGLVTDAGSFFYILRGGLCPHNGTCPSNKKSGLKRMPSYFPF